MSIRIPGNIDYISALGGIGDNVADAIYKYRAPKLWAEAAEALAGRSSEPVPLSNLPTSGTLQAPAQPTAQPSSGQASSGFDRAVHRTLGFEGGYTPNDVNGPANFGINQGANPDVDVKNINKQQAIDLYKKRYWDAINGDQLEKANPALAYAGFDTAVNAGPGKALQLIAQSGGDANKLLELRKQFQDSLIAQNPEKYGQFAKSWNNRIAGLQQDVVGMSGQPSATGQAPPNQVADASGVITPAMSQAATGQTAQMDPSGVIPPSAGPRATQYSPELLMRLMQNPYTRMHGQMLMQKMIAGNSSEIKQFGDNLYRVGGDGSITPLGQIPQKETYQIHDGSIVKIGPNGAQVVGTLPKDRAPVSLSEGQTLVDPKTGAVIASGGQKNDVAKANAQREGEADRLGLQGDDRTQYIFNGKVPSQTDKQTTDQANAALYATRMNEANKIINDPNISASGFGMTGAKNNAFGSIPVLGNALVTKEYQQLDQARRDFLNATLRRESGAAINESEFANGNKQYFPQPGDASEVIQQKARNRQIAVEGIANASTPQFREQFFGTKKPTIGDGKQQQRQPLPQDFRSAASYVDQARKAYQSAVSAGRDAATVRNTLVQDAARYGISEQSLGLK